MKFIVAGGLPLALTSCSPKMPLSPLPSLPSAEIPAQKPSWIYEPLAPQVPVAKSHKIGLLFPLSGVHAELGKGLLEAAELALFEGDAARVTLLPHDTNGDPAMAAENALEAGADLLIGPVFAAEVEKIKPLAALRKTNLICFSTDQKVAGGGAYVLGVLPAPQIERILEYATQKGLTKIAALTPVDAYGKLIDQTLKHLKSQDKIHLLGITHYEKGDILEGNPGNERLREDVEAYKAQGAQALLIPEGGENLALLMRLLGSQESLTLLGSGQWDSPETLEISDLTGGIFPSTLPESRKKFEARFQKIYGYTPPRLASLAYDAIALALVLADEDYTPQALLLPQGFEGTEGVFRFTPQGLNERGFAMLEVTPTGFKTVSPPLEAF